MTSGETVLGTKEETEYNYWTLLEQWDTKGTTININTIKTKTRAQGPLLNKQDVAFNYVRERERDTETKRVEGVEAIVKKLFLKN